MWKKIHFIILLVSFSFLLALIQNYLLWGYWIVRPSYEAALDHIDRLIAISTFRLKNGELVVSKEARATDLKRLIASCSPYTNECMEGRLLLSLEKNKFISHDIPFVDKELLETAWSELTQNGWLPKIRDTKYKKTGIPYFGLAIQYSTTTQEFLLLTYDTGEIANDRYTYSEVLYSLNRTKPSLIKQMHFFYEIAGLEGILEWPLFWMANFLFILVIWFTIHYFKKIKQNKLSNKKMKTLKR